MPELVSMRHELTRQREKNDRLRVEQSIGIERASTAPVAEVQVQDPNRTIEGRMQDPRPGYPAFAANGKQGVQAQQSTRIG